MWDKPDAMNWLASFLFALSFVMFLYGVVYVVVHLPIFPLREIRVEGELAHVTREQVRLISSRYIQGNFFTLDLDQTRDAFQKLPWARNVSVRRRWPDQLEVVIEEHQALARWGSIALVNTHGELFHAASDSDLPVFYGPSEGEHEVAEHYGNFNQLLAEIHMKVSQLTLTPRHAWEIKTDTGLVIALGREAMEYRLAKLISVYDKTIASIGMGANGDAKVKYVDLRYPNGFAVRRPKQSMTATPTGVAAHPAAA